MKLQTKLTLDYYLGGTMHVLLRMPTLFLGRVLRRDHRLTHDHDEVTILKLLGGGSLVIAYPMLLALKDSKRISRLNVLASPATRSFAEVLGVFDEVITIRDTTPARVVIDSTRAIARLWRTDTLVDLEIHSRLTCVFSLLTCALNRIGFYTQDSYWRKGLASHLLFCHTTEGIYYFYDQIAVLFDLKVPDFADCVSRFRADLGLGVASDPPDDQVCVAPCCSDLGRERMLTTNEWADQFKSRLLAGDAAKPSVLNILGGKNDVEYSADLEQKLRQTLPEIDVQNHAGKLGLRDSVMLLGKAKKLYAVDSSLLHFARLLGTPTVSFWGPTDPISRLRPSTVATDDVRFYRLPCSPCVHIASMPPCKGNNLCMRLAVNPDAPVDRNPMWMA